MENKYLRESKIKEMQKELDHIKWAVENLFGQFLRVQKQLDSYRKFNNGDIRESENFCTFPDGKDKCSYKSKDLMACVGLRKCKWAKLERT